MALLPGPDDVPAPDFSQMRRQGIGSWNPQVAGQGDQAAARGLESLGSTIGNVSQEIAQSADQVQLAQAHGTAGAALATAHGGLQDITDPSQVLSSDPSKPAPAITDINTKINAAASMISNPIRQAEFKASMLTPVASYTAAALERGRTLNNQTGIASLEQNTTDIINNAATLSDENAAGHALDSIGAQVSALVKAGALNPQQGQKFRQESVQSFGETRYKYLVGQLEAQPPGQRDYSALMAFTGHMLHGFGAGTDGASVAHGEGQPVPQTPATPQQTTFLTERAAGPRVDTSGVNGDFAGRLQKAVTDAETYTGQKAQFISIGRSADDQAQLRANYEAGQAGKPLPYPDRGAVPLAAEPGHSLHEQGLAADIKPGPVLDYIKAHAGAYGLEGISSDPAHIQLAGASSAAQAGSSAASGGSVDLQNYKRTVGQIESASGKNEGGLGSYYQFEPGTWARYGSGGTKGTAAGEDGPMNRLTADNQAALTKTLGRAPTAAELYLAHQQGADGAAKLLQNPNTPAGQLIKPALIASNGGDPNAPASQFVQMWANKYARISGNPNDASTPLSAFAQRGMPAPGVPSVAVANAYKAGLRDSFASPAPYQIASLGPVGLPVQPPIGQLPSTATLDDASASASSRAPPSASWPAGAQGVMGNADGSLSYQMKDGSFQPVPGSRATGAPHNGFAAPPAGSVLAAMSPNTRATLQLEGINAIRRMQREDQMANQKDDRGDLQSIANTVKAMESGVPIGDKAWAALTNAYSGPGATDQVHYAYAVADNTRRTIQGFQFSSPQDVRAAIANMQSDYAKQINNPATAAQSGVLAATIKSAQSYLSAYEQGVAKDPIGRAAMQGVIGGAGDAPVKPLDPTSATFSQDVADRVHQAQVAAALFKQGAVNYLQPEDKVALRQIASQGGDNMVNLAKGIVGGAGANAYAMFKQIGKEAAPLAQIGQWAMDPNADHSPEIRQYADYLAAAHDPQARKNLTVVDAQTMRTKNIADPLQDAGSELSTDDVARLRGTASVLASANVPAGMDPKNANSSLPTNLVPDSFNRAVGGTKTLDGANWWGGIAKVGGSYFGGRAGGYSAIVPTNMRQDLFESAIGQINQNDVNAMGLPPVASGGQKLTPADIQKGKFVAVTNKASGMFNGQYQVQFADPKDGVYRPAMNTEGKPWLFDMRRAQGHLGEAIPGLFMSPAHGGGSPSGPIIPPSHNYQNVKGLSITPDDVASADTEADASGTP